MKGLIKEIAIVHLLEFDFINIDCNITIQSSCQVKVVIKIGIKYYIFSATKNILPDNFVVKERGKIIVKGKGELLTYWMEHKINRSPPPKNEVSLYKYFC